MEGVLLALAALTPLNLFLAVLGGVVFGFAFRNFYLDSQTIYLCLMFTIAFSIGRVLFVATTTATGAGLVGTILFLLYVISTIVTRRILRRNNRYK